MKLLQDGKKYLRVDVVIVLVLQALCISHTGLGGGGTKWRKSQEVIIMGAKIEGFATERQYPKAYKVQVRMGSSSGDPL